MTKVLSLFDGIGCGRVAFERAGISVDAYYAYEIDPYAIKIATHNFPDIIERGDVQTADFTMYENIDWLIGGSPCTTFSVCQKQKREREAWSGVGWDLFMHYVRAIREAKPKLFLYENNASMSREVRDEMRRQFGFEEVRINSSLVSGQYRDRFYWVGKRNMDGSYSRVDIPLPQDKGILMRDVIGAHGGGRLCGLSNCEHEVAYDQGTVQQHSARQHVDSKPLSSKWRCGTPVRIGTLPNRSKRPSLDSQQYRVYSVGGKSVSIKANGGGLGACTGLISEPVNDSAAAQARPCEWDDKGVPIKAIGVADGKLYDVVRVHNGQIEKYGRLWPLGLPDGDYIIRKLTVRECARLQTLPDDFEFPVSDTRAYRGIGAGWTVDVISHILRCATL